MRIDGGRADDGVAALMDEEADLLVVPGLSIVLVPGGHLLRAGDLYSNLVLANAIAGIPAQIGSPSMAERFDHPWPNSAILATESIKNTVYVKAKECTKVVSMEELVVILRRYFTSIYPQVGPPDTPAATSSPSHRTPPIYGVSHLSPRGVGIAWRDGRCGVCVSRWAKGAWVGGRRACDGRRSRASGASGRGSHVVDMGCQLVECVVHKHQPRAFCAHFL